MTKEELAKIPFKTGGHLALEGEYRQNYYNEQYGFALVDITKRSSQGFVAGKTRREYLYQGKRYRSMDKFLEAIKDVEFKGLDMWIARSEGDSCCHLFVYKPVKVYDKYQRRWKWESDPKSPFDGLMLPASKYKLITFENSPIEVELKLK